MVKIIKEICAEDGIRCESFSYDWILRLSKDEKNIHIYGYQFENNSATSQLICTDKCATSELLRSKNIPAVEHKFFMSPDDFQYIGAKGNWEDALDLLHQHGKVICKPNEGTGGKDVYLASNAAELEVAAKKIFAQYRTMAISPFYFIEEEYRVILLNGEIKLVFSKKIPSLAGDGVSNVRSLFLQYMQSHPQMIFECGFSEEALEKIPEVGEKIPMTWKHNLGQGASPEIIGDPILIGKLGTMAMQAARAVNVHFSSVDIINSGGNFIILEINSGIMMESFAGVNDIHYQMAKEIYREAIHSFFL
jgi:glutathione synthase/RimK-type ligase-like ATP-grasp enzyme